jgi:hypothetical protein
MDLQLNVAQPEPSGTGSPFTVDDADGGEVGSGAVSGEGPYRCYEPQAIGGDPWP